jgi:excisionase family DNA binding protein
MTHTTDAPDPAACLSLKAVARMLDVHPGTVRRWVQRGTLPAYRLGKRYLIRPQDARDLLRRCG